MCESDSFVFIIFFCYLRRQFQIERTSMKIVPSIFPSTIFLIIDLLNGVQSLSEIDESVLYILGEGCGSKDIRYEPKQLQLLENCKVIFGNLRISDMPDARKEDFDEFTFPNLNQVTGFVIVHYVSGLETLSNLFPNLVSIKGDETFRGSSLVIRSNMNLTSIGLKSLTRIGNGDGINGNPQLCFNGIDGTTEKSVSQKKYFMVSQILIY